MPTGDDISDITCMNCVGYEYNLNRVYVNLN